MVPAIPSDVRMERGSARRPEESAPFWERALDAVVLGAGDEEPGTRVRQVSNTRSGITGHPFPIDEFYRGRIGQPPDCALGTAVGGPFRDRHRGAPHDPERPRPGPLGCISRKDPSPHRYFHRKRQHRGRDRHSPGKLRARDHARPRDRGKHGADRRLHRLGAALAAGSGRLAGWTALPWPGGRRN